MKCFQLSCFCRLKLICTNGRHFRALGVLRDGDSWLAFVRGCGWPLCVFGTRCRRQDDVFPQGRVGPATGIARG